MREIFLIVATLTTIYSAKRMLIYVLLFFKYDVGGDLSVADVIVFFVSAIILYIAYDKFTMPRGLSRGFTEKKGMKE